MKAYSIYHSPIGEIAITADPDAILSLGFAPPEADAVLADPPLLRQAHKWLDAYFSGERPDPNALPIRLVGTPFQLAVWEMLSQIPYGQTVTYGQLARRLSPTMSAQAVGQAVGRNPISIVIPCHRVLGAHGRLTGYAGGLNRKRALLQIEGVL